MTALRIAGLATAGFILASASAFAQAPAPQAAAPASPPMTHAQKLALEKSCKNEWTTEKKAGHTKNLHYKTFIADCMKKGA